MKIINLPTLITYPKLKQSVLQVLAEGKERARLAVEREKLLTYHQVGRLLNDHLLAHKDRADYGDHVIERLAGDLEMSRSLLYHILDFHRKFRIVQSVGQLTWTHCIALLGLQTKTERDFYVKAAVEASWSVRDLRAQIKLDAFGRAQTQLPAHTPEAPASLSPDRGCLYTYRVVASPEDGCIDLNLGFNTFYRPPFQVRAGVGKIVQVTRRADKRFQIRRTDRGGLFTYRAYVERVIDGDTLWARIDCGFGIHTRQKLRLQWIDTPEMSRAAGQKARDFVQQVVDQVSFLVLTTNKPDKYDRYLADVFYLPRETDPEIVCRKGVYLNQQLLDEGLAKRFEE